MGADPISMMMIASAVAGAAGDIGGGFSEASQANVQSQIARNNAILASQNATYTTAASEAQAANQGLKTRAQVGAIKAGQAASGVDVNSGSAVDVRASQAELGMLDQLTIRSNAARQAYGYELESQQNTLQSKLYRKQAKIAPYTGALKAGGSLLSGLAKAGDMKAQQAMFVGEPSFPDTVDLGTSWSDRMGYSKNYDG